MRFLYTLCISFLFTASFSQNIKHCLVVKTNKVLSVSRQISLLNNPSVTTISRLYDKVTTSAIKLKSGNKVDSDFLECYFNYCFEDSISRKSFLEKANKVDWINLAYIPSENKIVQPPTVPIYTQINHNTSPTGVDAKFAWGQPGGLGDGVRFLDIEFAANFNHKDLVNKGIQVANNARKPYGVWEDHGTASLGIVFSEHNSFGTKGIAPNVEAYFSYPCANTSCSSWSYAIAILDAIKVLNAGDVMLLEIQNNATVGGVSTLVPVEYYPAEYDAIKLASDMGIIVVEAAGNGANNLDSTIFNRRFDKSFRSSGAILVGAGIGSTRKLGSSNYGSRVDLFGDGTFVTSTGYGDIYDEDGKDLHYTGAFNGTSSGSAIVAGAICSMQGLYYAKFGKKLNATEMRDLLYSTGVSTLDTNDRIGRMPNLREAYLSLLGTDTLQTAEPLFSIKGGFRLNAGLKLYISHADSTINIYYTIDGSTPTVNSPIFTDTITIDSNTVVSAIDKADNKLSSNVVDENYTFSAQTSPPVFNIKSGVYSDSVEVIISHEKSGVSILYTLDGSIPTFSSPVYTKSLIFKDSVYTIKAVAFNFFERLSEVIEHTYYITNDSSELPVFSHQEGTYNKPFNLFIAGGNNKTEIYYSIDSLLEFPNGTLLLDSILIDTSKVIFAYAKEKGMHPSKIVRYEFELDSITSVNQIAWFDFSIYPNPASDKLTVNLSQKGIFKIISVNGQVLLAEDLDKGKNEIDITSLQNGLYNCILLFEKGVQTGKFSIVE